MGVLTDQCKRSSSEPRHSISILLTSPTKKPRLSFPASPPPAAVMPESDRSKGKTTQISSLSRYIHGPQRIINAFGLGLSPVQRRKSWRVLELPNLCSPKFQRKPNQGLALHEYRKLVEERIVSPGIEPAKVNLDWQKPYSPELKEAEFFDSSDASNLKVEEERSGALELVEERIVSPGIEPAKVNLDWQKPYSPELKETEFFDSSDASSLKVEEERSGALELEQLRKEKIFVKSVPLYKDLYADAKKRDSRLNELNFEQKLLQQKFIGLKNEAEVLQKREEKPKEELEKLFVPLLAKEEEDISHAFFSGSSREVLVTHEPSNIVITREVLQCLMPGAWLNDEVINLYLELLKEREKREPKKFLKCHFFNTFFFKKLISAKQGYDFKAVKRWTTQRKLGYTLIECDKIFVPIHKEIHWCLAVINIKDESFQYLDSLGGMDSYVLKMLARYLMDEVKDKSAKNIDIKSWKKESIEDIPLQKNGWDCGMFMLKYADLYSRGLKLCFSQEHMIYFRKRTALEILNLRAE